jgi:hypothetical protein
MKGLTNLIAAAMFFLLACQEPSSSTAPTSATDTSHVLADSVAPQPAIPEKTEADSVSNTVRLIQLTLQDLHKEDISNELIDSFSRQFKYSQYDLNNDGEQEILVGLTGPFFCGSGGCTIYLLTHHGDVITKFSVVRYPLYVDTFSTKGWRNLIFYSGGANRLVQWNGKSYPSNPSTLQKVKKDVAEMTKLLDWELTPAFKF